MARRKNLVPSYLLHSSSGQARVRIDGRDHLLGQYGTDESKLAYAAIIGRIAAGLPPIEVVEATPIVDVGPSVNEICLAFLIHAEKHYVKQTVASNGRGKKGKPTSELHCFKCCIRIVRELYGIIPAKEFGPLALKAVRLKMISGDPDAKDATGKTCPRKPWARANINRMVSRIRQIFKYAIENEMIEESVLAKLQTVAPLLAGRTEAPDHPPREAVEKKNIEVVRKLVRPLVQDLIDLQLLTGSRPGELLMLNSRMIDQTEAIWTAKLADHKCVHRNLKRTLHFGPQAQAIIAKYLSDDPDQPLFDIERTSYCRAITRACEKAKIDRWTPHWLRHTYITRTREERGIEAAQAIAGHSTTDTTAAYSTKMDKLARKTAAAVG